eukprot:c41326_g1_i1 orf=152-391(-)
MCHTESATEGRYYFCCSLSFFSCNAMPHRVIQKCPCAIQSPIAIVNTVVYMVTWQGFIMPFMCSSDVELAPRNEWALLQ